MTHENPFPGQVFAVADLETGGYDTDRPMTTDIDTANVVTSLVIGSGGMHRPVLDIDLPVKVLPSSTPGHFHLFIDHELTWPEYSALLDALAEAGLVEPGYVRASRERGYTSLRLPWVRKAGAQ